MQTFIVFTLVSMLMSATSYGYIDPGSGSAIMSAIIGFFVVIGLTIKSFWYKVKSIFTGSRNDDSDSNTPPK